MANRWSSKYSRERKRVTSILRELRKAGYRFNDNIIPAALPRTGRTEQALKAATLELRKMTRGKFYKESTGRVIDTGEILPVKRTAKERRRQTREIRQKRSSSLSETNTVYNNVGDMFDNMFEDPHSRLASNPDYSELLDAQDKLENPDLSAYHSRYQYQYHLNYANIALQELQRAISEEAYGDEELGKAIIAKRLQEHSSEIAELINTLLYESGDKKAETQDMMNNALTRFASIIRGYNLSEHENEELTMYAEMDMGVEY